MGGLVQVPKQKEYEDTDYFITVSTHTFSVCQGSQHLFTTPTWIKVIAGIRDHATKTLSKRNVWKANLGENFALVENFKY